MIYCTSYSLYSAIKSSEREVHKNMKFITSKELRNNPSKLWESGTRDETIVTVNGKPKAIVIGLDCDEDIEEQLKSIRRAKAESALDKLRLYSVQKGLNKMTDEEIIAEVGKVRKEKNRI